MASIVQGFVFQWNSGIVLGTAVLQGARARRYLHAPKPERQPRDAEGGLVSRFRSSPEFAARSVANFGIEGHEQIYNSSAALNPKFATGLAAIVVRTSGSRH